MVSRYFDVYNQGYTVVSFISVGILEGYGYGLDSSFKNHCIVWAGTISDKRTTQSITLISSLETIVNFKSFSWGEAENVRRDKT